MGGENISPEIQALVDRGNAGERPYRWTNVDSAAHVAFRLGGVLELAPKVSGGQG
jgi:hypothetical protein